MKRELNNKIVYIISMIGLCLCATSSSNAQWFIDSLTTPTISFDAVSKNDSILFIGGYTTSNIPSTKIEVYNNSVSFWDPPMDLPAPRARTASIAGDSAIYVVGGYVDGAQIRKGSNTVFIYKNGNWNTDTLPNAVFRGHALKVGSKIIFAGFADSINIFTGEIYASNKVFMYDEVTGIWSTSSLSSPRTMMGAATDGNIAMFAGGANGLGITSNKVDIYQASTNTWSTDTLSVPRALLGATYINGKFYFAGGMLEGAINYSSDVVDVFDGTNWSTLQLSKPRAEVRAVSIGNYAYFISGGDYDFSLTQYKSQYPNVDVLNTLTGSWSRNDVNTGRSGSAIATVGNKIFFAGGVDSYGVRLKSLEILNASTTPTLDISKNKEIRVFPNPSTGNFTILLPESNAEITISTMIGQVLHKFRCDQSTAQFEMNQNGIFILTVKTKYETFVDKIAVSR